jgi:hypothetical protein
MCKTLRQTQLGCICELFAILPRTKKVDIDDHFQIQQIELFLLCLRDILWVRCPIGQALTLGIVKINTLLEINGTTLRKKE